MTTNQKYLVRSLFAGKYLMKAISLNGTGMYKLYSGNANPVCYVSERQVKFLTKYDLLKKDKASKYTINLSMVRQLHGKSWIKIYYKSQKKAA